MTQPSTRSNTARLMDCCPFCDYSFESLPESGLCPECGRAYDSERVILVGDAMGKLANMWNGRWQAILIAPIFLSIYLILPVSSAKAPTMRPFVLLPLFASLALTIGARLFSQRRGLVHVFLLPEGVRQRDIDEKSLMRRLNQLLTYATMAGIILSFLYTSLDMPTIVAFVVMGLIVGWIIWLGRRARDEWEVWITGPDGDRMRVAQWKYVKDSVLVQLSNGKYRLRLFAPETKISPMRPFVDAEIAMSPPQVDLLRELLRQRLPG